MTNDSVWTELRILVRLSLPLALAQLGLVTMGLVDTAIIGHLSVADLASVAIGRSILFGICSVGMGISAAIDPLASQAVGAGEPGRAFQALRAGLRASALITIPTIVIAFLSTLGLVPLGVDPALVPRVHAFLIGNAPGVLGFLAFLAGKSFLQAHGVTRPALLASLVANIVNAVVCSVLVRGDDALRDVGLPAIGLPSLGALGAGIASSIGSLILAAIVLYAAYTFRPAVVVPGVELPKDAAVRGEGDPISPIQVMRLGLPIGLQFLAETGVFSLGALLAGRLGTSVLSAHQIASGLAAFTVMGALGVGGATAVRVGHAIGAKRSPQRAGLIGLGLGAAAMCVAAVVFAVFPRQLIGAFTSDREVIDLGAVLLRIAAMASLFDGVQAVAAGALRGAGDVRFPFLVNVGAHWLFGLPISLGLGFGLGWGATGLWWGLTAGLVSVALLLTARFVYLARRGITRV